VDGILTGAQGVIYLFCNTGYGRPFIEVLARVHRRTLLPATLVFSGRHDKRKSLNQIALAPLLWTRRRLQERRLRSEFGLASIVIDDINASSFLRRVSEGDLAIIAGFNQIFKKHAIAKFQSVINFHPSVLPLYRGPVPSYWCLVNGESRTGFSMHYATERIDDGEILCQEVVPITDLRTESEVDERIAIVGAAALERYLNDVVIGRGVWTPKTVDAFHVYKNHIQYRTFPSKMKVHG
jgi:hypothetical protein